LAADFAQLAGHRESGALAAHNLSCLIRKAYETESNPVLAEQSLMEAEAAARRATALIPPHSTTIRGVIALQLARVLALKSKQPEAASTYREALQYLTPASAPKECREAALEL